MDLVAELNAAMFYPLAADDSTSLLGCLEQAALTVAKFGCCTE